VDPRSRSNLLALYSGGIALLGVIGLGGALQGHPVAYVLGYSLAVTLLASGPSGVPCVLTETCRHC